MTIVQAFLLITILMDIVFVAAYVYYNFYDKKHRGSDIISRSDMISGIVSMNVLAIIIMLLGE